MVEATPDPVATPEWVSFTDEQLLGVRMCDLKLSLAGTEIEQRIEKVNGDIRIDSPEVVVKSLRGARGDARMSFNGVIGNIEADPTIDLAIYAQNIALDQDLKQALPPRMARRDIRSANRKPVAFRFFTSLQKAVRWEQRCCGSSIS